MKNKTFACVMGLVLALSLTACGEEEVIVENTNEEVSVEVQTQEATEAPTETVAETGTEAEVLFFIIYFLLLTTFFCCLNILYRILPVSDSS